jgi:hypothetical protein
LLSDWVWRPIEHTHDVLMNELAGAALPSQKFGANAAWLRLNVILYNLLSAYKRVGLPEKFHTARPKRLRNRSRCASKWGPLAAGPMVRIRFPPAVSPCLGRI